jgi:hypothetical protein
MLRLAVTLVVPVLVAFALASGATRIIGSEPQTSTWTPWGDRVASSPQELAGWLAARGSSYGEWARRHPAAAARLEGRPVAANRSLTAVEPASGTALRDVLERVLLTVSVALVALVALALALAGARRALASGASFPRASRAVGSSFVMSFRDARGRGRDGGLGPGGVFVDRPVAPASLGRAVAPVEQTFRALRWFYGTHRDEILWLGLGSACAVIASLAITL